MLHHPNGNHRLPRPLSRTIGSAELRIQARVAGIHATLPPAPKR